MWLITDFLASLLVGAVSTELEVGSGCFVHIGCCPVSGVFPIEGELIWILKDSHLDITKPQSIFKARLQSVCSDEGVVMRSWCAFASRIVQGGSCGIEKVMSISKEIFY